MFTKMTLEESIISGGLRELNSDLQHLTVATWRFYFHVRSLHAFLTLRVPTLSPVSPPWKPISI